MSDSLWPHGLQPTRLLHPWDFPGKSTGVGCHCLLQELSLGASYVAILYLKTELIDFGQEDVKDITVKGLEVVRCCSQVYLEAYSSVLTVEKEVLVDA